ncbi:MAG: trypsin-like peptidase domain-containing protein [Deltaproteobacteria bacterium]|nr:trypsin-like peptidase domain-containing protein [Deltaproteobacteria bacterium]
MHRYLKLVFCLVIVSCTKTQTPEEAAKAYAVQITNGFTGRGGVLITDEHVIGDVSLVPSTGETQFIHAGKAVNAGLQKRDGNFGVLIARNAKLDGAAIGNSSTLKPGDILTLQSGEDGTTVALKTAKFTAWRIHKGRAYMEIDFIPPKNDEGTGVFGPDGRLVGLLAFTLGDNLTYVLPIEYLTTGPQALTTKILGAKEPSAQFIKMRDEAATKKNQELLPPPNYKRPRVEQFYSRKALIGRIIMLDKPAAEGSHTKPIKYQIEAIDQLRARRTIAKGSLAAKSQQWVLIPEDKKQELLKNVESQFGADYINTQISPYEWGELRYRIPFSLFCSKVTEDEVHALTLTLADERNSGEIPFADLVNICGAIEESEGDKLEQEWNMASKSTAAANKKEKKKKKGKKKRRR